MCTLDCDYKVSLKYMTLLTWIWFENIITKKQEGDATNNLKDKCYVKKCNWITLFFKIQFIGTVFVKTQNIHKTLQDLFLKYLL